MQPFTNCQLNTIKDKYAVVATVYMKVYILQGYIVNHRHMQTLDSK